MCTNVIYLYAYNKEPKYISSNTSIHQSAYKHLLYVISNFVIRYYNNGKF